MDSCRRIILKIFLEKDFKGEKMKGFKHLSTTDLLLARQWLLLHSNSTKFPSKYVHLAAARIDNVDKELWARLISSDTPWGEVESFDKEILNEFKDNDFEKTLDCLRDSDVNE